MMSWIKRLDIFSPPSIRLLFWLGGASFFLGLFIKLTWELSEDSLVSLLDKTILIFIFKLRISPLNGAAVDLTALGSPTLMVLFTLLALLLLLLNKDHIAALYLTLGSVGAGVWTLLLKHLISRERPDVIPRLIQVSGFSYPSGHSLAASSFYLLLTFLACRHYRDIRARAMLFLAASTLIALVAFSRLYLGVHYPSDVASGVFLGAAWVFLLTGVFSLSVKR